MRYHNSYHLFLYCLVSDPNFYQILSQAETVYVISSQSFMNSSPRIYTESVLAQLQVGKDMYYADIKFLGITTQKDTDRKAYINQDELDLLIALRSYVAKNGTRKGFKPPQSGGLVVTNSPQLSTVDNKRVEYPEPEEPIANDEMGEQLFRAGAELKARETALPHLVIRAVADQLDEDQLPEDLREKVNATREAANPKWNPGDLASSLIARYVVG
jgi:hypothetical protein